MIQLSLFPDDSGAIFSKDRKYRYVLWRKWDNNKPMVMFIGLNPSTANEDEPDNTIIRISKFTKAWGYGGFYMLNLFTFITTYPKELKNSKNSKQVSIWYLKKYAKMSEMIVFAWGEFKEAREFSKQVIEMFPDAYCLFKNHDGSPRHPLYIDSTIKPIKF